VLGVVGVGSGGSSGCVCVCVCVSGKPLGLFYCAGMLVSLPGRTPLDSLAGVRELVVQVHRSVHPSISDSPGIARKPYLYTCTSGSPIYIYVWYTDRSIDRSIHRYR